MKYNHGTEKFQRGALVRALIFADHDEASDGIIRGAISIIGGVLTDVLCPF